MTDGTLWARAVSDDEPQNNWMAKSKVKIVITRADAPNLDVRIIPDRGYYLPGQLPKLTIIAKELSGAPIRKGMVSVKSEWDGTEFASELDDMGKIVVTVDPQKKWDWIRGATAPGFLTMRSWDFPVDVRVADAASGATELRRAILALAPQEIYLVIDDGPRMGSEKTLGIVSSHVDKSPASVEGTVELTAPDQQGRCPHMNEGQQRTPLGRFQTNRYGVARLILPAAWITYAYPKREDGPYSWYAREHRLDAPAEQATKATCIVVQAKDRQSKSGTLIEKVLIVRGTRFATRISTDHALYLPGEPVRVGIESDEELTEAAVEIRTSGWGLVAYQHLRLRDGRGEVVLPYSQEFRGLVTVQVYAVTAQNDPNTADSWSTNVLYPTGEGMKAGERWGEDVWRPDMFQPDNSNPNVMVVVTAADMERGIVAGMRKEDLLRLNPSKPIPDGLDLVAWELLGRPQPWVGWPWGYGQFQHEAFDKTNLEAIAPALQKIRALSGPLPATESDLVSQLKEVGVDFAALRDGWGTPYRVFFMPHEIWLASSGADKKPNTKDDYIAARLPWP